jgi:hypothetical protein
VLAPNENKCRKSRRKPLGSDDSKVEARFPSDVTPLIIDSFEEMLTGVSYSCLASGRGTDVSGVPAQTFPLQSSNNRNRPVSRPGNQVRVSELVKSDVNNENEEQQIHFCLAYYKMPRAYNKRLFLYPLLILSMDLLDFTF